MGTRVPSPAMVAGEDARAPMQTAVITVSYIEAVNSKSSMNGDCIERLPQEGECREDCKYGVLESASAFAHRVLEEIEALAGTTACKPVQLVRLKKWAQEQGMCSSGTAIYC